MDAPDDRDIKLQRVSADLLKEFDEKLARLLWKQTSDRQSKRVVHRWTQEPKSLRLIDVLGHFQEWSQLLDPHLQNFLPQLVDAFLAFVLNHRHLYGSNQGHAPRLTHIQPLPKSICRILYTFCKVRGVKVISRFLNNEPKYLELMLRVFIEWDAIMPAETQNRSVSGILVQPLSWEERYVMLLWLSHLLLAPFDLASLSSDDIPIPHGNLGMLKTIPPDTPKIAQAILSISLRYVVTPSKEREAATILLARLALRPDMQRLGLLNILTDWAFSTLHPALSMTPPPVYTCIGVLSFLARLVVSGQVEDLAPLVVPMFDQIIRIAQSDSAAYENIRTSASARKTMTKILRTLATLTLTLAEKGDGQFSQDKVSVILEESIDYFLVALADKDTPVRLAASKALAIVALKLDADMAAEVVEAVIGSLDENILYEQADGRLVTVFEAQKLNLKSLKRNLKAVDAQRWHGLILTLAHLLFRRAPPPGQLAEILQSLVSGLDFEQRSTTGSSIGTGVRDASCFGIWAVSRKYTTEELQGVSASSITLPTEQEENSVLQMLAVELVCAACVDPSGNIRRGASAALQELIGRHPDTILEGIPLVQVVDYHAVARRSRAMIEVSKGAALLDSSYWNPLVNSLLLWRGLGSSDADSRRTAAIALGELSLQRSYTTISIVLDRLRSRLSNIPHNDVEARHGYVLATAATVDAFLAHRETSDHTHPEASTVINNKLLRLWEVFDSSYGPTKNDLTQQSARPELTAEATSRLIASLSCMAATTAIDSSVPEKLIEKALGVLLLCVFRGEDTVVDVSSEAASQLFRIIPPWKQEETIQGWFANIHASWKLATGRGQISALGAVFHRLPVGSNGRQFIIEELFRCTTDEDIIEKQVAAVKCLATGVLPNIEVSEDIAAHFVRFLNNYTTDRRGDIGSFIRIEAIQAVQTILDKTHGRSTPAYIQELLRCLCRLAAEKLDKVRFQAWCCLEKYWESAPDLPPLQRKYEHFSQVSSVDYFHQLLQLLRVERLREPLVQGLITSASAGTEGLIRASRSALIDFIEQQGERKHKWTVQLIEDLIAILNANLTDDRYAIPAMEMSAFLLDSFGPGGSEIPSLRKLFLLTQKAHFKSSNISRLEAAIKVYCALCRTSVIRADALKKLTSMLLHPYPKVRTAAADSLFVETQSDIVKGEDWSAQPNQLKSAVERARAELQTV